MKLFEIEEEKVYPKNTCKDCIHRQRLQCSSKIFQYCGVRKSNLTNNGLLKIKFKTPACEQFKQIEK